MRRKAGTFLIVCGVLLVCAALGLFGYNQWTDSKAGQEASEILAEVADAVDGDTFVNPYDTEMTEVEIDGHLYVGYVVIPTLGIELPVMSEWSYANLKISPCRYTGSTKTGDLVICAHNYRSHFGPIKNLEAGDEVYFVDMDGIMWSYEVALVDVLAPTAVEEMTDSGYDLTLFTCTYGGRTRVTVRCVETE